MAKGKEGEPPKSLTADQEQWEEFRRNMPPGLTAQIRRNDTSNGRPAGLGVIALDLFGDQPMEELLSRRNGPGDYSVICQTGETAGKRTETYRIIVDPQHPGVTEWEAKKSGGGSFGPDNGLIDVVRAQTDALRAMSVPQGGGNSMELFLQMTERMAAADRDARREAREAAEKAEQRERDDRAEQRRLQDQQFQLMLANMNSKAPATDPLAMAAQLIALTKSASNGNEALAMLKTVLEIKDELGGGDSAPEGVVTSAIKAFAPALDTYLKGEAAKKVTATVAVNPAPEPAQLPSADEQEMAAVSVQSYVQDLIPRLLAAANANADASREGAKIAGQMEAKLNVLEFSIARTYLEEVTDDNDPESPFKLEAEIIRMVPAFAPHHAWLEDCLMETRACLGIVEDAEEEPEAPDAKVTPITAAVTPAPEEGK